ncbi:hypothetical protein LguiB_034989 [Lonicera macranthoides]
MAFHVAFSAFLVAFSLIDHTYATTPQQGGEGMEFSYSGAMGPNRWGSISPKFLECARGKWQSPVNIVKKEVVLNKNLKPLLREYHPATATLVNNGFNVGMRYQGNAGVLVLDGKNYTLIQMHWHSPSEHRIDGIQYDAELHLVHKAYDGSISVVAVLYHYGHPDPLVGKIQSKLVELGKEALTIHEQAHIALGTFNTKPMRKPTHKYYRYTGSFTTPPCSGNVTWSILGKVRSISREQVEALKIPLELTCKNNSRPLQPLNGRKIEEYDGLSRN